MATEMSPASYKFVTVNTAPERAKRLIGRVVEDFRGLYNIDYVSNSEHKLVVPYVQHVILTLET
jgi:hypothetical protein